MKYDYTNKKVTINGKTMEASFPKKHSRIKGIIIHQWDENADDIRSGYANIHRYHNEVYILWEGNSKWEYIDGNMSDNIKYQQRNGGLYNVLYNLESEEVRDKIYKRERIAGLKAAIKESQKELVELERK